MSVEMITFEEGAKRVLVIGYGNPGRLDDGIGPELAARLEKLNIPGVRAEDAYQLNVEHATTVAEYDVVIFADACLCDPPPYAIRSLEPRTGTMEFTTHTQAPEGVLGLAHEVFGARTRGYSLGIRGYDFHEFGEHLSEGAEANLEAALRFLEAALEPGGEFDLPTASAVDAGP